MSNSKFFYKTISRRFYLFNLEIYRVFFFVVLNKLENNLAEIVEKSLTN